MIQKLKAKSVKCKTIVQSLKLLTATLLFLALTFTLYVFYASPVNAQESTTSAASLQPTTYNLQPTSNLPPTVSPVSPLYTDLLIHNIFHTFSCIGIGQSIIGQPCLTYQMQRNAQGILQGVPYLSSVDTSGGLLGTTGSLIGLLYTNRPVRSIDYLATVGQELGFVKEANAQVVGSGAQVLNPIVNLWQVSRNISYVIMIIIFVIIGLMVMFRTHINPQTVITAQAALPGLVIGLILITFSYFLAGLISDMAFVGTNVVGYYFAAAQGVPNDPERLNLVQRISTYSVFNIFGPFIGITSDHANNIFDTIMGSLPDDVARAAKTFVGLLGAQLVAPLGGLTGPYSIVTTPLAGLLGGFEGVNNFLGVRGQLIKLAVVVILLYAMFRLLFRLVNSFLTIIFLTLSAPFQFLFAALPGRQGIATEWIKNMLGNVLVFPAVLAVFYFVAVLLAPTESRLRENTFPLKVSEINQIENNSFISATYAQAGSNTVQNIDIVGKASFPLFGGMELIFIKLLLALGALIALPAIPDIVVRAVYKASEAGQLLGQELGGNIRSGQGYASQHGSRATQFAQQVGTGIFGEHQLTFDDTGKLKYSEIRPGYKTFIKQRGLNPFNWFRTTTSKPPGVGGTSTSGV